MMFDAAVGSQKNSGAMSVSRNPALWLPWLGGSQRALSRQLGLADNTLAMAFKRGSRPPWLDGLAVLIDVPPDILIGVPPDAPAAKPYKARALVIAARRRLAAAREGRSGAA